MTVKVRQGAGVKAPAGEVATAKLADSVAETVTVTDATGRVFVLKKPLFIAQFRLTKILGEAAQNLMYLRMVTPTLFIHSIDGIPVGFPQSEREIEALIARLDEAGYQAVVDKITEHWGGPEAATRTEDEARDF